MVSRDPSLISTLRPREPGNILLKGEYATQKYNGFAPTDIRSGGKFNGFMVEGTVAF